MTERVDPAAETPGAAGGELDDALHRLCRADAVWAERYEGWDELGRGGSARVVKVRSRSAGAVVALKIFPHLDADDRRRFQREVTNAQRLASPFVVRTFSPFLRSGLAWIEMEWVDGPNLRRELERRADAGTPFSRTEAVDIALCVVRAVLCAHEQSVIHRDVKPANVLLPATGRPAAKLGDFGVSRIAGSTRATATGLLPGTPQFVAPEVIDGQQADAAADVYSLCLTLHMLFSGGRAALPVPENATPAQWLRAQTAERPIPLRTHDATLPGVLEELLLRGLAKDPAARPGAHEVLAVLETLGDPPATTARRTTAPLRARPAAATFLMGAASGAVAVLAAFGAMRGLRPSVEPGPPPAVTVEAPGPVTPEPAPETTVARDTTPQPRVALPAPTPPLRLSASARDSVSLENRSGRPLQSVRVTLVGASGVRCAAALPSIAPGEDVTLGFEGFVPVPDAAFRLRTVEIAAGSGAGPTAFTLEASP